MTLNTLIGLIIGVIIGTLINRLIIRPIERKYYRDKCLEELHGKAKTSYRNESEVE